MPPAIVLRGVTLSYGDRRALADVDLELPAGAVTVVIGPNGSGKSTLLHAISGLVTPTSGEVAVLGQPPERVRPRIAHVLQATADNRLLPLTVREVVTMGRYAARGLFGRLRPADHELVDAALARVDVADLASRQLRELSGGQRQRVLVAQGLAQAAEVLLLDEPVTGLDLVSQRRIAAVIDEERQAGRAVVLTTHDLGDAERADVVVLLAGEVVASGAPEEVLVRGNLLRAYGGQLVSRGVTLDEHGHGTPDAHDHGQRLG